MSRHVHIHFDDYGPGQNPASHSHHGEMTVGGHLHVPTPHQVAAHPHLEAHGYKHTMTSNAGTRHYWHEHPTGRFGIAMNKKGGWNGFNAHGHEGQGQGAASLKAHLEKTPKERDGRRPAYDYGPGQNPASHAHHRPLSGSLAEAQAKHPIGSRRFANAGQHIRSGIVHGHSEGTFGPVVHIKGEHGASAHFAHEVRKTKPRY